jgi:hypothetical protein
VGKFKGKGKVIPVFLFLTKHHAMKAYLVYGGISPRILWPRHYMEFSGQIHAPAALTPGKSPRYPLYRRLGGSQSRSGRGGEEKNSQLPSGIEL